MKNKENDMDEYIKREDAIKTITWNGLSDPPDVIHLTLLTAKNKIRGIPAADVVLKSKVADLPRVAYNKKHERYQVIHKSKQGHILASKLYRNRREAENALAKLKKRYAEDDAKETTRRCPDCKHFVGCETACGGEACDGYAEEQKMDRQLNHESLMTCFSKEELVTMYLKRLEELAQSNLTKEAALADLKAVASCRVCANLNEYGVCALDYSKCQWKWRGDV